MIDRKVIALIEPLADGHRISFLGHFVQALQSLDFDVVVLFPDPTKLNHYLDSLELVNIGRVRAIEYQFLRPRDTKNSFRSVVQCLQEWRRLDRLLSIWERESVKQVEVVFFCWLDSYLQNNIPGSLLNFIFGRVWSGLYFHPKHLYGDFLGRKIRPSDIDSVLMDNKCLGIAIHDEGKVETYSTRVNKRVILFPEIADSTSPDKSHKWFQEIKRRAGSRHIVGLIGLTAYKGLATMVRVANQANPVDFFFVIAGHLDLSTYGPEDRQVIEAYINEQPENGFILLEPLEEGEEFNSVFDALDTPFLVYDNFASSSNNLTKAAYFRKRVIASKGYCIGRDVDHYGLGLSVEERDVKACHEALIQLKNNISLPEAHFDEYCKKHSNFVLKEKFEELLAVIFHEKRT